MILLKSSSQPSYLWITLTQAHKNGRTAIQRDWRLEIAALSERISFRDKSEAQTHFRSLTERAQDLQLQSQEGKSKSDNWLLLQLQTEFHIFNLNEQLTFIQMCV